MASHKQDTQQVLFVDVHSFICARTYYISMAVRALHPLILIHSLPCFLSVSHLFCLFNSPFTTVLLLTAKRAVIEGG